MNAMPRILSFLLIFVVLQSCKDQPNNPEASPQVTKDIIVSHNIMQVHDTSAPEFPKSGTQSTDFLPASGLYGIQYEAEGDLNGDGLADKALVLRQDADKSAERPMLILLQTQGKTYHLDKISTKAMPPENDASGYRSYGDETIRIVDGVLHAELYGIDDPGAFLYQFKYIEKDLVLTRVVEQYKGDLRQDSHVYDPQTGELTQEVTLRIDEVWTTDSKTITLEAERHLFESVSPIAVIQDVSSYLY